MLVENFTSGKQIELILLPSVVFGFLRGWQVLENDRLMMRIADVEFVANPGYTDREH